MRQYSSLSQAIKLSGKSSNHAFVESEIGLSQPFRSRRSISLITFIENPKQPLLPLPLPSPLSVSVYVPCGIMSGESRYLSPPVIGAAITIILDFFRPGLRCDKSLFVAKAELIDLLIYAVPFCAALRFFLAAGAATPFGLSRRGSMINRAIASR